MPIEIDSKQQSPPSKKHSSWLDTSSQNPSPIQAWFPQGSSSVVVRMFMGAKLGKIVVLMVWFLVMGAKPFSVFSALKLTSRPMTSPINTRNKKTKAKVPLVNFVYFEPFSTLGLILMVLDNRVNIETLLNGLDVDSSDSMFQMAECATLCQYIKPQ